MVTRTFRKYGDIPSIYTYKVLTPPIITNNQQRFKVVDQYSTIQWMVLEGQFYSSLVVGSEITMDLG